MNAKEKIIRAIELHCERSGLSPSTVGHKVANSSSFYQRLKDGANMRMDTYEKARGWFEDQGIDFNALDVEVPAARDSAAAGEGAHG